MINKNLPGGLELTQPVTCGNPWHGVVEAGTLTTTEGAIEHEWPEQPDSGDAFLFKVPGIADAPETPEWQQTLGMEWRNTAILSGWWERQIYGQPLPGGRLSWLFADAGITYAVSASGLEIVDVSGTKKLSGTVTLTPLVVGDATLEVIELTLTAFTLPDQSRSTFDVVAIKQDGAEVLLGLWPSTYLGSALTYAQGNGCRALAKMVYDGHDYRIPPMTLLDTDLTVTTVTPSTLKSQADMAVMTREMIVPFTAIIPVFEVVDYSVGDWVYTGPESQCHWREEYQTWAWVPEVGEESSERERDFDKIVGAYIKSDGSLAYVVLRFRYDYAWQKTYAGVGGGEQTRIVGDIWNGGPFCDSASTGWGPADLGEYLTNSGAGSLVRTVELVVDGVVKSSVASTYIYAEDTYTPFHVASKSLAVDDFTMPANGLDNGTISGAKPDGDLGIDDPPTLSNTSAYALGNVVVHAVRYSNNAWGLVMLGLSTTIHGGFNAYRAGIVNLVTGTRGSAPGYLLVPSSQTEYLYTNLYVSVEPEYGSIVADDTNPVCYV